MHNPSSLDLVDSPHAFANLLYLLYGTSPRAEILPGDLLEWLALDFDTLASRTLDPENPLGRFLKSGAVGEAASKSEKLWSGVGEVVTRFGFAKGESGLVVNGRVSRGGWEEGEVADAGFWGRSWARLRKERSKKVISRLCLIMSLRNGSFLSSRRLGRAALISRLCRGAFFLRCGLGRMGLTRVQAKAESTHLARYFCHFGVVPPRYDSRSLWNWRRRSCSRVPGPPRRSFVRSSLSLSVDSQLTPVLAKLHHWRAR